MLYTLLMAASPLETREVEPWYPSLCQKLLPVVVRCTWSSRWGSGVALYHEEREAWGVGPSTVGDSWLASSCLHRRPISKVMTVLISTSKQASQHWARDTCVAI